jgi:cation transport protein ChaC
MTEQRQLRRQVLRPEDWGNEPEAGDRWVFGYGSLMWHPGFEHQERRPALLHGYHRDMCVISLRYRGTPDRPGLVLGLRGRGSCRGIAYRVAAADWPAVRAYLHDRELGTYAYIPRRLGAVLSDGRRVSCHTFVADRAHHQYAGHLDVAERIRLIRQGCGPRGTARDYLASTVAHLDELGIRDGHLHDLLDRVDGCAAGRS